MELRLLDLFCGAGGAALGYDIAGFEVHGFDIKPQPNFPFEFTEQDALTLGPDWIRENFDAVHASPPCQAYSNTRALHRGKEHPDLVDETRRLLVATGLPYVIENVPGAPLVDPARLCGSSFGLRLRRHRIFETNFPLVAPPCDHAWQDDNPIYTVKSNRDGVRKQGFIGVYGKGTQLGVGETDVWRDVMEIGGSSQREMAQSIPPAYTEYIGARLRRHLVDGNRSEVVSS